MKKFARLAVLVLISLLASSLLAVSAAELSDIKGHWAEEYIEYGIEQGYISGYEDGTFLPDKTVTRAEFSKMINSAVKITSTGNAKGAFVDVADKDWYATEVKRAENAGYITGYEDGSFRPNNSVTRQEAAVILSRIVLPVSDRQDLSSFADSSKIDSWAEDSVSMIAAKGYIKGDENKNFNPKGALTRSQAAKLICEFVRNENIVNKNQNVKPSGDEVVFSETLFTDDIVIDAQDASELSVVFSNCRVLGTVVVKVDGVTLDFESSDIKNVSVEAEDAYVGLDKSSKVKNATVAYPATFVGGNIANIVLDGDELSNGLVKLSGTYDNVAVKNDALLGADVVKNLNVESKSSLVIQSGTVENLTVSAAAKNSTINLTNKVVVENADNKAAVTYLGKGTIEKANNEVAGVVFDGVDVLETTGKKPTDGEGNGTTDDEFFKNVVVSPANKKSGVSITSKIIFTFEEEVFNNEGKKLTASYIEDNFKLTRTSEEGTKTAFIATVSSNNKKITLEPAANLKNATNYYVVIPEGVLTYEDASENGKYVSYFKTIAEVGDEDEDDSSSRDDEDEDDVTITIEPGSGDSAPVSTEIEITFSDKVYKTAKKGTLDAAYCESTAFEIRKETSTGDEVSFTATVASTGKKVVLTPDEMLEPDTRYYVIVNKKLYTASGDLIAKKSSYFKTEDGLAVSITPENGETNVSTTPEIVFEFSETVLNFNEKPLTETDIEDLVVIREKTNKGEEVLYSVEIVSDKKFVITPEELTAGTKYYIMVEEESFFGETSEEYNEDISYYFTVAAASAPMVTPANGKKYVGTDTEIEISFSDKLYAASAVKDIDVAAKDELTDANIADYIEEKSAITVRRDSEDGREVKFSVELSSDGSTITIIPNSELAVNKEYFVTVKSSMFYVGETSSSSAKNKGITTSFFTNEALCPTFYPEDGDKNIEVDAELKITYEESIYNIEGDELTKNYVATEVVRLYNADTEEDVDFGVKVSGRVITIVPDEDLEGGTEYVLKVNSETLTNKSGLVNQSYSVTFKTESKVVKTITCDPENKEEDVSIYVNPVVKFASPIYKNGGGFIKAQYAKDYITLRELKSSGKEVDCTVEFDEDYKEFTIIPDEPLDAGKKYYVVIASGKFEYEDESSVSSKSFYFTTSEEEEEPDVPVIECPFCHDPHDEEDHECSACGEKGHEGGCESSEE